METPITFRFVKMDLTQFATFTDGYNAENADLSIFNRFQFAYNFEEHLVLCKTIIEISERDRLLLKADLDSLFKIEDASATVLESDTEAVIPPRLLAQFASLAYGAMRGVLYFKTADTPFSNFILPPNDVASAFVKPQRFARTR